MSPTPYQNNPDTPFPDQMHGTYCRIDSADGETVTWIVIDYLPCTHELISKSKNSDAFKSSALAQWLHDLKKPLRNNLFWLYQVEKFMIGKEFIGSVKQLAEHRTGYEKYHFDDYNKMMDFCEEHYRVTQGMFRKEYEVDYPQN